MRKPETRIRDVDKADEAAIIVRRRGNKEQYLPLPRDTREALAAWLAVRPAVTSPAVFIRLPFHPTGPTYLHYEAIAGIFKGYARAAGIPLPPRGAFHLLRHTAGQRMADLGFGIEQAQVVLGHESPNTTRIYYEVNAARLRNAIRRFSS